MHCNRELYEANRLIPAFHHDESLYIEQHGKLDTAVELLGEALHIRIKAHGGLFLFSLQNRGLKM